MAEAGTREIPLAAGSEGREGVDDAGDVVAEEATAVLLVLRIRAAAESFSAEVGVDIWSLGVMSRARPVVPARRRLAVEASTPPLSVSCSLSPLIAPPFLDILLGPSRRVSVVPFSWLASAAATIDSLRRGTPVGGPPAPGSDPSSSLMLLIGGVICAVLLPEASLWRMAWIGVPSVSPRGRLMARIAIGVASGGGEIAVMGVDVDDEDGPGPASAPGA